MWRNQLREGLLLAGRGLETPNLKPFGSVLRHHTKFFGGKISTLKHSTFSCYYTHINISNDTRISSIRVCMKKLYHLEVDLPLFTAIVREDVALVPVIHGKGASHVILM